MSGAPAVGFCGRHSFHDPPREGIEVVAGLPEVDDSPATIDRPRCVEEEPFRWCAIGVGVIVSLVELLRVTPGSLTRMPIAILSLSFGREPDATPPIPTAAWRPAPKDFLGAPMGVLATSRPLARNTSR